MKAFVRLCVAAAVCFVTVFIIGNIMLLQGSGDSGEYRVEAKRLCNEIEKTGSYDLTRYPHITGLYEDASDKLYVTNRHYLIINAGGKLYRAEYTTEKNSGRALIIFDLAFAAVFIITTCVLVYLYRQLIRPFEKIKTVPTELARGNLAVPISEEKSRMLGKFTWGIDMLRESIEQGREREMKLRRDKRTLVLSLSHDIKTPLSAIKLSTAALRKGLYKDKQKQDEVIEGISQRADEIEKLLKELTESGEEELISFDMKIGEEFLGPMIERIKSRYLPRLEQTGTKFIIGKHTNPLLICDTDRLCECLQNLIENAIKYGDGKLIEISFSCEDGCELITVSNTGSTPAPHELTGLFESFKRGSNSDGINGSGLGLYICKRLMTSMKGDIFADIKENRFEATLIAALA